MSQESDSDRSRSKLTEMVIRGSDYREDFDVEMFGEEVPVVLRALPDLEFLPLASVLADKYGMDEEELEEAASEAVDEVEEAMDDEDGTLDMSELDTEFVEIMQEAAILGITGSYDEEGEFVEHDEEEARWLVEQMVGGASIEIGGRVLEISGDVRDAEKFRGGRGSVERSGSS